MKCKPSNCMPLAIVEWAKQPTCTIPYQVETCNTLSLGLVADCANSVGFQGLVPLLPHFCKRSVPEVGVCGVYSESACCTDDMFEIFAHFGRRLCCLLPLFWDVSKWLAGAYKCAGSHLDHLQTPVVIRHDKRKWLDFGMTPDPQNVQPHPGFVWVKSGYSEAIAWRKVCLTKQRNVDLTTDGLWTMPLNTGHGENWLVHRGGGGSFEPPKGGGEGSRKRAFVTGHSQEASLKPLMMTHQLCRKAAWKIFFQEKFPA